VDSLCGGIAGHLFSVHVDKEAGKEYKIIIM